MFTLISPQHMNELPIIARMPISDASETLHRLIETIREEIPEKKRISYGRYSIIKKLGEEFYPILLKEDIHPVKFGEDLFENPDSDPFVRSLGIQLVSIDAVERGISAVKKILPLFEAAASADAWEIRECCAGFIRKLIPPFTAKMLEWYKSQTCSANPLLRRFAVESLRPVADNKWLKNHPQFSFAILELLYEEPHPYPRTSVGNSLSDWSKIDREKVYSIVEELVKSGDKNSYWIAYRACRNLVKKDPEKVMDLLKVDEYRYKKRVYARDSLSGSKS